MKKIFAIIMSVMMIACFMPTAAFAGGGGGDGGTGGNISVSSVAGDDSEETGSTTDDNEESGGNTDDDEEAGGNTDDNEETGGDDDEEEAGGDNDESGNGDNSDNKGGSYVPASSTTTTAGTVTTKVTPKSTTAADGTKTTTAAVNAATATSIVESAIANKSTEVVIDAGTANGLTETAAGSKTEVAIPAAAISQISEKTDASVTIKSDAAVVTLDKQATAAVAEVAGTTGEVKLSVETIAQDENKVQVDLKLETANGAVSDFKGGSVTVTIKLGAKLAEKEVKCLYIDNAEAYHKVNGQKNADGTFTFKTAHFSSYAVMEAENADKLIAEQIAKAKELTTALKLKASSQKTAKGYIQVTLSLTKGDLKAIEDLGYTVKYKFYRSTKKSASYKAKYEKTGKTYTNTAGKKGTKYYYKARVMVYDGEGTLVAKSALTQCKYACRVK